MSERRVSRLLWEEDALVTVYTDDTAHRFEGAHMTAYKVHYPEDSAVVAEEVPLTFVSILKLP